MNSLYKTPGFLAFISMVFLNAFVDLGHKIIIQNTVFKVYDGSTQVILTAIVNGLILLPFILLFTPSGFIADRFKKPKIMRGAAIFAFILTLMITAAYYMGWFQVAFAMTFMMAVQSAFYSPAKYGYIREIAGKHHLVAANSWVQSITIVAILLGMFVFSILFENILAGTVIGSEADIIRTIAPLGWLLVLGSLIELYFAYQLPELQPESETEAFQWGRYFTGRTLLSNIKLLRVDSAIWLSIVGLSVFWGVSQVVLATFPSFAKETLAIENTIIIQGLLACSGLGIILGSWFASKVSTNYIETALIPLGAMGIVVSLFLLPQIPSVPILALDILAFGFFGGLFIIPLNSLIQFHARTEELGMVLAGNNWVQNVIMFAFLGLTVSFSLMGIHSGILLHLLALVALIGAVYTVYKLPQSLVRYVFGAAFSSKYRINVQGLENMPSQGGVLLLGNHISWLDWAMLQIASPRAVGFVIEKKYYQRWYLGWFLDLFGVIPISSSGSRSALAEINKRLKLGEVVCLFPEGAISRNGQLGEFKKGFERCTEGVDGVILPFYLRGLWGSRFSRSSENLQSLRQTTGLRRDVIVAFAEPLAIDSKAATVKTAVFDLSINTWQIYTNDLPPIAEAWIERVKQEGGSDCLIDIQGNVTLSRRKALAAALLFSSRFKKQSPEQNIGLLLPTSSAGLIANMGVFISGKTVVNLNFSASVESLLSALEKAEIKTLYTSRRFITKLEKKNIALDVLFAQATPVYLEDMKQSFSKFEQLQSFLATYLPTQTLISLYGNPSEIEQPAAILFSSGSEGAPKGVVLSHKNIMGNIKQVSDVMDTRDDDVMVASLPLFHAFGLTITGLLPMVEGVPAICHPDPTDVLNIAKGISQHQATIFCGTSTFLRLFNKNSRIHPLMLESLRIIVAGAERLNPEIRDAFNIKFSKPVYEGYGTTETTPVATVNIPDRLVTDNWSIQTGAKQGTVGLPLPGSSVRIVDPNSMQSLALGEDGLILIGGTQVMQGYLNDPEKTAQVIVEIDGQRWYKTGDKGHLDKDGFLVIVDRYSRFAKIGGEMISLGAIEASINPCLPEEVEILSTTVADDKKGEKVVLLYVGEIDEAGLKACIAESGLNSLMAPNMFMPVAEIPKLGSGKSDFGLAKKLAAEWLG